MNETDHCAAVVSSWRAESQSHREEDDQDSDGDRIHHLFGGRGGDLGAVFDFVLLWEEGIGLCS